MNEPPEVPQSPKRDRRSTQCRLRLHAVDPEPTRSARTALGEYERFLDGVRRELRPRTLLGHLMSQRVALAAWQLASADLPERKAAALVRVVQQALQTMRLAHQLSRLTPQPPPATNSRREPSARNEPPPSQPPYHVEGLSSEESTPSIASQAWRDRLAFDPAISRATPIVKGTWVTASQVVALIVDGWTWDDILSDYPELTYDDLRACLSYTLGE